jgi:hypothetical protein
MQTFLPYTSFKESAKVLDNKRLGKQRVEAYQVLKALTGQTKGWVNHPATVMWRGYENYLCRYGAVMCNEWIFRGFKDSLLLTFIDHYKLFPEVQPWWYDYEPLHSSHKSNLYRKDPIHYARFAETGADEPYVWCEPQGTFHWGSEKESHDAGYLLSV